MTSNRFPQWWYFNKVVRNPLRWRQNGCDSVSNHQPHDCLLNRLFRRRSKKTSKLRVTGLCVGNSPGTSEFPAQMASYAENVSIWWRHHAIGLDVFLDVRLIKLLEEQSICRYFDMPWNSCDVTVMKRPELVFHSSTSYQMKRDISHALCWSTAIIYIIYELWYLWIHQMNCWDETSK